MGKRTFRQAQQLKAIAARENKKTLHQPKTSTFDLTTNEWVHESIHTLEVQISSLQADVSRLPDSLATSQQRVAELELQLAEHIKTTLPNNKFAKVISVLPESCQEIVCRIPQCGQNGNTCELFSESKPYYQKRQTMEASAIVQGVMQIAKPTDPTGLLEALIPVLAKKTKHADKFAVPSGKHKVVELIEQCKSYNATVDGQTQCPGLLIL